VIRVDEAAVVRRIFSMAAQHYGLSRIAKTLNDEGLLCPRPQQGRPAGWSPSSIHALLRRDLYRGVAVWNKTRKRTNWGVKHQQPRPERDWLRVEVPHLAIVDEALWTAAHAAMAEQRARFGGERRHRSPGRLPGGDGADTRYLLAGLLQCSHRRGGMEVRTRSHGSMRVPFVGCSSFHRRGRRICPVNLSVPEAHAIASVLTELESSLLNPRVVEAAVERAVAILCQPDDDGRALRQELIRLEREVRRYTAAVAAGGDVPFLVAELRGADDRRRELVARLQVVAAAGYELDPRRVLTDLRERLSDWRSILFGDPVRARGLVP
jgi:site-specific DNA recombinase